ncbi:MAG: hypothetical protein AAB520_00275 [Patescibacteria group bacterium]
MRIYIFIAILLGIIFLLSVTGILLFVRLTSSDQKPETKITQASTISGKFDINGVIPVGSVISVTKKEVGSVISEVSVKNLPAVDESTWSISGLTAGKTYEIIAQITVNNKTVASSSILTLTSPANGEKLVFNISGGSENQSAIISGNIQVNGYIPANSTISVFGKLTGESSYALFADKLPAKDRQFMSYIDAKAGAGYEIIGYLYDSSKNQIGSSSALMVTAPAVDELITINSIALAPTPTQSPSQASSSQVSPTPSSSQISGSIDFNGVAPTNSRIVIFQKLYNAPSYQLAVDNITPVDNSTWQWNSAKSSTWYNLIAILKQRNSNGTDTDIATSSTASVAAPGSSVVLTVNSNISIPAPTSTITMLCQGKIGNYWNAQLTIPYVTGALSYWYEVGTYSGGGNVTSTAINSSGTTNLLVTVQLNPQTAYYFRYAYANVANTAVGSSQFSPFSSNSQGNCGN